MTITSRALIAVLAMGAFSGCGDDTTSDTNDGSTSADPSTGETADPTGETADPTTSGTTTAGPTSSSGEGSTSADPTTSGTDSAGESDSGETDSGDTDGSSGSDSGSDTEAGSSSGSTGDTTGTSVKPFCGDGVIDDGEECDDGLANSDSASCTANCVVAVCGDGLTDLTSETCDDGDTDDLDACRNDCTAHEVVELALGSDFSCARFDSGQIKCWGHGASGRLGYGNLESIGDDETPANVAFVDLGEDAFAESVIAGASHTCAALSDGSLRCWGAAGFGQLGRGSMVPVGDDELPASVDVVAFGEAVRTVGSGNGSFHSCAVLDSDSVKCWGQADDDKLGVVGLLENVGDNESLSGAAATDVGALVEALATGQSHTCALTSTGTVRCWGSNANGALGYGTANDVGDDETPASVGDVALSGTATVLAAGYTHSCVVLDDGDVQCWGRGNDGRLGYGSAAYIGYSNTPADVGAVSLDGPAQSVSGGLAHTCALLDDGGVQCWGFGAFGQLGYGNIATVGDDELPSDVGTIPLGVQATVLATGANHTCIVTDEGGVRCWGQGANGRLGYGNTDNLGDDEALNSLTDIALLPE